MFQEFALLDAEKCIWIGTKSVQQWHTALILKKSQLQGMPSLTELIKREEKNPIRLDLQIQDLIRRDTSSDSTYERVQSLPRHDPFICDLVRGNTPKVSSVSNEMKIIIYCKPYRGINNIGWKGFKAICLLLRLEISATLQLSRATQLLHPISNEYQSVDSKVDCPIVPALKCVAMYRSKKCMLSLESEGDC